MRIHDIAFYVAGFFLTGVFLDSAKSSLLVIALTAVLIAVLFLLIGYLKKSYKLFWLSALSLFIIAGSFYAGWYNLRQIEKINIPIGQKISFAGVVIQYPEQGNTQKLIIELQNPYAGKILVRLQPYPSFDYGDLINFEGVIKSPEPQNYADYLAKDGIFGVATFPKTELIAGNRGSDFQAQLFKFKEKIILNFQKILPQEQAAFLGGITLGERAEFSKEFKEAMSKSGTTHLVALSGYNISILAIAISVLLGRFIARRLTFILTIFIIIAFVLATGAEASVVRAAIMGIILLVARQIGRVYNLRNAISIAAFLMVMGNPKILRFDIGFQLSFLALLGIACLGPVLQRFFKLKDEPGFLSWRENLVSTLAAQLMVAPLLISSFGNFSLVSLLANVLILGFIPFTMAWGFVLGFVGFVSYHLSLAFGWFINIFLFYEIFVINFFGQFGGFGIKFFNPYLAVIYYPALLVFILYNRSSSRYN